MKIHAFLILFGLSLIGLGQEKPTEWMDVELSIQVLSSKPGNNRSTESDPAIMTSILYRVSPRLQAGIGSGLQTPHYNALMLPVYVQVNAYPNKSIPVMIKSRVGQMIPTSDNDFEGGVFSEIALAKNWSIRGNNSFQLGVGYTHQRIRFLDEDRWWGSDRETTFRFNRVMFSIGFVF